MNNDYPEYKESLNKINQICKDKGVYSLEELPNNRIGLKLTTKEGIEKQITIREKGYMEYYLFDVLDFISVS